MAKSKRRAARRKPNKNKNSTKKGKVSESGSERKLKCPGVRFCKTKQKWLSIEYVHGKSRFCAYGDTEKEAIEKRDLKMLQKFYGPTAKTFFPKKNYDVKQCGKKFRDYKIRVGITNAVEEAVDLKPTIGPNNIFSKKMIEKTKTNEGNIRFVLSIIFNGMKVKIAEASSKKVLNNKLKIYLANKGHKHLQEYTLLRKETIELFRSKPCAITYKFMMFAHGACTVKEIQDLDLPAGCKKKLKKAVAVTQNPVD